MSSSTLSTCSHLTELSQERTADSASLGEAKQCLEMEIRVLKVNQMLLPSMP